MIDVALSANAADIAERWLAPLQRSRPGSPEIRWRQVSLAELRDDRETLRRELPPLLADWAEADPDFEAAREARALAERLAGRALADPLHASEPTVGPAFESFSPATQPVAGASPVDGRHPSSI